MTPEQTPQESNPSVESIVTDKIVDTSFKAIFTDIHGELEVKKTLSAVFCLIGVTMGIVLFYKGLYKPEGDFVASYEVFQFFIVSGLAGLGLSTVENLFKKK